MIMNLHTQYRAAAIASIVATGQACTPARSDPPPPPDIEYELSVAHVVPLTDSQRAQLPAAQIAAAVAGRRYRGVQDDMLRIEAVAPGFAGFYLGSHGELVARITKSENESKARAAMEKLIAHREEGMFNAIGNVRHIRFLTARHPLSELVAWQEDLFPILAGFPGFSSIGVSEQLNAVLVAATSQAALTAIKKAVVARGIPEGALKYELRPGGIRALSLTQNGRSIFGTGYGSTARKLQPARPRIDG